MWLAPMSAPIDDGKAVAGARPQRGCGELLQQRQDWFDKVTITGGPMRPSLLVCASNGFEFRGEQRATWRRIKLVNCLRWDCRQRGRQHNWANHRFQGARSTHRLLDSALSQQRRRRLCCWPGKLHQLVAERRQKRPGWRKRDRGFTLSTALPARRLPR